jgi:hypothetical protein
MIVVAKTKGRGNVISAVDRVSALVFRQLYAGIWHILRQKAMASITRDNRYGLLKLEKKANLLFLTGANMAGKSTFMKAFGISVYLAHMGFPVAVKEMAFSVRDGLFSSQTVGGAV